MDFKFIYQNCKICHEEIYIEDLTNTVCKSCLINPTKQDRFKCSPCDFSINTKRELRQHYNNTVHKKNINFIRDWLFKF